MLAPPDRALAQRDPGLQGLGMLLDVEAFLERLRHASPAADLSGARVTYVRYKPATSCLVGYRLQLGGREIDAHACAFVPAAQDKLRKIRTLDSVPGPLGPGWTILEDRDIAVGTFPNDRRLKALRRLGESSARRVLLQQLLPSRPDLWSSEMQTLHYKPERRYVAGLTTAGVTSAVVRVYSEDAYRSVRARMDVFRTASTLRVPRSLGSADRYQVQVVEWLPGRCLADLVPGAPELSAAAGLALGELHAQAPGGLPTLTKDAEIDALLELVPLLGFLHPRRSAWIEVLARRVVDRMAERPVFFPTHGDFYADQVLLGNGATVVLDLDEAVQTDPAADLGNFIAHGIYDAIRGTLSPAARERLREGLLEGYRTVHGTRPKNVDGFTTSALLRLASRPFRDRMPDWPERMDAILREVETIIESTAPHTAVSVTAVERAAYGSPPRISIVSDPFGIALDATMPFLTEALDPRRVEDACRRWLPDVLGRGDLRVGAIRVLRHKPGRRCLIEYELEIARPGTGVECLTVVAKARARGLDTSTYQLLQALWHAGFRADCADGIAVPEPIGLLPEFQMWLQRKVCGVSATAMLAAGAGPTLAGRIATAACKLHEARLPAVRQHTIAEELRILEQRLRQVAWREPAWADRLIRVLQGCRRVGAGLADRPLRGIHRDFYADHIIVDGEHLFLLDFDLYAAGDPALDVGNFLGHVAEFSLRTWSNPAALRDVESRILDACAHLAEPHHRAAVAAWTTLTLARHISLSTEFSDRRPFTAHLLDLCEQRLAGVDAGEAGLVSQGQRPRERLQLPRRP